MQGRNQARRYPDPPYLAKDETGDISEMNRAFVELWSIADLAISFWDDLSPALKRVTQEVNELTMREPSFIKQVNKIRQVDQGMADKIMQARAEALAPFVNVAALREEQERRAHLTEDKITSSLVYSIVERVYSLMDATELTLPWELSHISAVLRVERH